jgi:hypothetical protein
MADQELKKLFNDITGFVPSETTTLPRLIIGDVNKDGNTDVADLVAMQQFLLGNGQVDDLQAADMNGDKIINVFDLVLLRKLLITK